MYDIYIYTDIFKIIPLKKFYSASNKHRSVCLFLRYNCLVFLCYYAHRFSILVSIVFFFLFFRLFRHCFSTCFLKNCTVCCFHIYLYCVPLLHNGIVISWFWNIHCDTYLYKFLHYIFYLFNKFYFNLLIYTTFAAFCCKLYKSIALLCARNELSFLLSPFYLNFPPRSFAFNFIIYFAFSRLTYVFALRRSRDPNGQQQYSTPAVRPVGGAQAAVFRPAAAGRAGPAARGKPVRECAGSGTAAPLLQPEQERQGSLAQR